jgi:hypothetical protein
MIDEATNREQGMKDFQMKRVSEWIARCGSRMYTPHAMLSLINSFREPLRVATTAMLPHLFCQYFRVLVYTRH